MNRVWNFEIDSIKYVFDGNNIIIKKENNIKNIENADETIFIDKKGLRTLALNVINDCNLKCDYCFANFGYYKDGKTVMKFEIAKKAVDLLLNSAIENGNKEITIAFFGGEPLLNFDLIKKVVDYAEKTKSDNLEIKYLITTNGTLFDLEKIKFMKKYKFQITLSIDGGKELHNSNRKFINGKGSFEVIQNNFELLLKSFVVNARITINNKNYNILKSIKELKNLGFRRFTFAPDYNLSQENFEKYLESLSSLFEYYYNLILKKEYIDITNITRVLMNILFRIKKINHCNAGLTYFSVATNGNIYRCPRFTDEKDFLLGNINNLEIKDINYHIKKLRKNIINYHMNSLTHKCNKCPFLFLCGGACYHYSYINNKTEFDVVERECTEKTLIYEETIKLITKLNVEQRKDFILSLKTIWKNTKLL
ncbi:hypothetical protein XO10_07445 [Marinitoga sp. 1135]|uniref:Radical SAM additional 4Fe4S-binding domain protein n=1 Tax=Marinitoga piezophila (strain DSM 14283 / JCM 11233 / KA3) TaxID=443254 RepID=H2J490_MARPK|nr:MULTISPECIES: radical SAM protein [Marinitoga]AEX85905.1 radical SAM additional 4Fe4S-binding domain protein [Marinitoga piezophila KA3]APT76337.1 hypothetical protein LN42_08045 [Marinitoga sp. 1137]NUU96107.1 hypothetical protein [Marinitoga sp. 1135]NUU98017.1 hypothetical protein [Marinitoga sp. 1138]